MNGDTIETRARRAQIIGHATDQFLRWLSADDHDEGREAEALILAVRALRSELRGEPGKSDTLRARAYVVAHPEVDNGRST